MTALVIGNSVSRKDIDLHQLSNFEIYGCNGLYRDFEPNHLVATDLAMIEEIISSGYHLQNKVYTLPSVNRKIQNQVITLPNQTEEVCPSGIRALKLALIDHTDIYMIGMDFTNDNHYAGTPTYAKHWNFDKWIPTIESIIQRNQHCKFSRIGAQKRNITPHSNFKELTVQQFTHKFYSH